MAEEAKRAPCSVCRGTRQCTFCNGDGFVVEHDKMNPCGVCDTTGICPICRPQDKP
jgi:hypothetical protein